MLQSCFTESELVARVASAAISAPAFKSSSAFAILLLINETFGANEMPINTLISACISLSISKLGFFTRFLNPVSLEYEKPIDVYSSVALKDILPAIDAKKFKSPPILIPGHGIKVTFPIGILISSLSSKASSNFISELNAISMY